MPGVMKISEQEAIQYDVALRRLEFLFGLVSKEDIVAWADDVLMRLESPPQFLYDLSLAGSKNDLDVSSLLRELSAGGDPTETYATAFRRFSRSLYQHLESGVLSPDEVAARLYKVAWQTDLQLPERVSQFCSWIDDEFELVRQGIKERDPAEKKLTDFLLESSA